jgi:predicted RNA-binding protein
MLKYRPKTFWGMLKTTQNRNTDVPIAEIAEFNRKIFYDENTTEEEYKEVPEQVDQYITVEELKQTVQHNFKANKSSGLSQMPL